MLYSIPIKEISYPAVVDFCSGGYEEGFILEYKRDFPPNNEAIAKTIAAFANTYGGLLIIGVNAPNGRPVAPFDGIAFEPSAKYEEKIQNLILAHIKEPVFPEVKVCEPINGKTFIIIRVAESHLTPHRVSGNKKIFVRTGQSSVPNDEATWDQIEWLASRRKKSEDFRHFLIEEAENYLRDACTIRGIKLGDLSQYFAILTLGAIPLFPQNPLIPYKEMAGLENEITVTGEARFPQDFYDPDLIQNGLRKLKVYSQSNEPLNEPLHGKPFEYTHLNAFGLYLWKRDVGEIKTEKTKSGDGKEIESPRKLLNFWWFSSAFYRFLQSIAKFYGKLGYHGTLKIWVELRNALNVELPDPRSDYHFRMEEVLKIPSNNLRWEKVVSVPRIREAMIDIAVEMLHEIGWSLNLKGLSEEQLRSSLKRYK